MLQEHLAYIITEEHVSVLSSALEASPRYQCATNSLQPLRSSQFSPANL